MEIGDSGKRLDWGKTGRFGVGFNTAYNLTDHPSFLSRRWFVCLDPHGSAVAKLGEGGRHFPLPILRNEHPALERCFSPAPNFTSGIDDYDGTVFTLPLRSAAQAKLSRISADVFDRDDFEQIVSSLTSSGAGMLLFTRHVLHLTVAQIEAGGSNAVELLSISTANAAEVKASRSRVYREMSSDLSELWASWTSTGGVKSTHQHDMEIRAGRVQRSVWQVCIGFFPDQEGKLRRQSEALATYKEKAIPEAGAAVSLANTAPPRATLIEGRYYCGLPLANPSGLPVHVHGCFDLDQSRSGLTSDTGAVGLGGERYLWNELLIERAVPRAWAEAIASLPREIVERDIDGYYALWPSVDANAGSLTQKLTVAVHRMLSNYNLYRTATKTGTEFRDLKSVMSLICSEQGTSLFDALVADGLVLTDPPLPPHIYAGAKTASLIINQVTSRFLCDRFLSSKFTDTALEQVPISALRKRNWLVAITKFILSTGQPALRGLPLALLSNGTLAAFGSAKAKRTFIATLEQRVIFKRCPHWFIDPEYLLETGLMAQDEASFSTMTPAEVLANLHIALPKIKDGPWRKWNSSGQEAPNEQWLTTLIKYLREHKGDVTLEQLDDFPLVPDQFGRLSPMSKTGTPLLRREGPGQRGLTSALERLGLPLVTAGEMLTDELQAFAEEFAGGIWWANRSDIIDTPQSYADQWSTKVPRFDNKTFGPILDLLSSLAEDDLSEELRQKLKSIPLVPLHDGGLATASDDGLFVPEVEVPEFANAAIKLVRSGPKARWSRLWDVLELPTLDLPTLIMKVIIPQYPSLADTEKLHALEFLKVQLKAAYAEAEKSGDADLMRQALRGAPLIAASDGEYRASKELFDPEETEIFDVLGEETLVPNLKRYRPGEKVWLEFFRKLGIKRHIDAADLIETIEGYSSSLPNRNNRRLAERLLKHISEKWEHFKNAKCSVDGDERLLADVLSEMAWLPARITARATLPGFRPPEDRFYLPAELYRGSLDHRVCSQAPLLGTVDPSGAVAKALGMPQRPLLEHVTAHFDHLRDLWSKQEGIVAPDLERSLAEIHRFFGELSRDSGPATIDVAARYAKDECIWDRRQKRFYRPADCFSESVRFFDPFKVQIVGEGLVAAGLDLLGRKKAPDWRDYVDFLRQMGAHKGDGRCNSEEIKQALYSLTQLATVMPSEEQIENELFVLLTSGKLGIAAEVWADDAPHLRGRLDLSSLPIVDDKVPPRLTYLAKQLSGTSNYTPMLRFERRLIGAVAVIGVGMIPFGLFLRPARRCGGI